VCGKEKRERVCASKHTCKYLAVRPKNMTACSGKSLKRNKKEKRKKGKMKERMKERGLLHTNYKRERVYVGGLSHLLLQTD
jgi:hypothetical protein